MSDIERTYIDEIHFKIVDLLWWLMITRKCRDHQVDGLYVEGTPHWRNH